MNYSKILKNQIINDTIDLSSFDNKKLSEWLVSNFVNILCDQKIFVGHVTLSPKEDTIYRKLFSLNAKNDKSSYEMEFGIIRDIKFFEKPIETIDRLSILVLENDFYDMDILNKLKNLNYNLSKIQNKYTLIFWNISN